MIQNYKEQHFGQVSALQVVFTNTGILYRKCGIPIMDYSRSMHHFLRQIGGVSPKITNSPREPWTGDYRGLARKVIGFREEYSIMLMQISPNAPDIIKKVSITGSFLPEYEKYNRELREKKENEGR